MISVSQIPSSLAFAVSRISDYWELTKPRLVFLVLLSALVGFVLASGNSLQPGLLFSMLTGTALVASGAMTLNQWLEQEQDSRMARTAKRPIPAGRLEPIKALIFGVLLSIAGLVILEITTSTGCTLLAAITTASYLFLYTPLKRKTSLCTIVGAVPGALPPLIGWAAAAGSLSFQAWILFSIVFLWQMPHFLAIGWMYRKEYAAAGFRMLSAADSDEGCVGRQILLYALALLPVSLLPTVAGMTGNFYFSGALLLGIGFVSLALSSLKQMGHQARWLFLGSILYLACLLVLMVLDKT